VDEKLVDQELVDQELLELLGLDADRFALAVAIANIKLLGELPPIHSANIRSSMSELRTATRYGTLILRTAIVTRPIAVSAQSTAPSH